MRLELIETIDRASTQLTEFCRSATPTKRAVMGCENVSEFQSAIVTAYNVKQEQRTDGYKYKVSKNTQAQTVTVSLTK